jgi:methylenetetrahydrofolate--tRNA-(uracil-5-)-methyltransferase
MDFHFEGGISMAEQRARVIGAGLAGSEAAWQLANRGIQVDLYEMRGVRPTKVHHTTDFAELVCSNSLGGKDLTVASGMLKEEMRRLGSVVIGSADHHAVPAGGALAVDREGFARTITERVSAHPNITVHREEITELDAAIPTIVATGPLTSEGLSAHLQAMAGKDYLYFFDAAAPILTAESIDMTKAFRAARMGIAHRDSRKKKGEITVPTPGENGEAVTDEGGDYINCPLTKEEYEAFWKALCEAENATLHHDEDANFFESCLPIEVIARRGIETMRYGPMKGKGLDDPRTGRWPYAVVQLRQDNAVATLYNMVGFQTQLKWGEQTRVFRMIPGLENAEFVRLGVMHRNTYLNSPHLLHPTLQWKERPNLLLAGQMIGVEGYTDSAAMGALAGINLARLMRGEAPLRLPKETMMGALSHYIAEASEKHFQPMNANWGLMPPLEKEIRDKKERRLKMAERGLASFNRFMTEHGERLVVPAGV